MLPHRLPFHRVVVGSNRSHIDFKGERRQPSLQPLPARRTARLWSGTSGVFSVRRAPLDKQVPLQGVSMSRRTVLSPKWWLSTTSWGRSPRTSASRPGTRHVLSFQRSGRGCHKVPRLWVVDPTSEESAKEGLSRGASVLGTKSEWASTAPRARPAPCPPWSCTVSVREGSLGGNAYLRGPRGQLSASAFRAECFLGQGVNNWQWEVSQ